MSSPLGRRCVVARPASATTAPAATLPASADFPGLTGYTAGRSTAPQLVGRGGLPRFLRPPSDRSAPLTPRGSWALLFQALHAVHGLRRDTRGSAPPWPPCGVAFTRRQDSLDATEPISCSLQ